MSLHKYDGVLQFNRLVLSGFAAVATKWLVEYLQVRLRGQARACSRGGAGQSLQWSDLVIV